MKKTFMRLENRPSPQGTRLRALFAGVAVSPMVCPDDGQQKDDNKRRDGRKASDEDGKDKRETNGRPQRGCGFVCLLFRGDPLWFRMIYRDISHIPYHAISQDTIRRDIVPASISRTSRTDTEASYPAEILFLDTEHY